MDGVHHQLDDAVQEPLRLLGVAVLDQLGRPDDIGEEYRDLLALALQPGPRGQDLLGQVAGGIRLG
jgi:hypothetical protein